MLKNKNIPISEFTKKKRHLPHWQNPGNVYSLTFRTKQLELDELSKSIINSAIHYFDTKKYNLISFVIMPDHVHLILQPLQFRNNEFFNLSEITHSIKSYTANQINKKDKVKKRHVWQNESYDRLIRNEKELHETINYILNNPVRKGLTDNGFNYEWFYLNPNT